MNLTKEQLDIFKSLSSKRRYTFWWSSGELMSPRARYVISTPELSKQLAKEIIDNRHGKT